MPLINQGGLFARLELVDSKTNKEVKCLKRERAGKRVLKGKTKEEFDVSKHNMYKVKMEFKFRETSSDNFIESYKLLVHIMLDNNVLLTFDSVPFRTVVRSPNKKTNFKATLALAAISRARLRQDDDDEEESDEESDEEDQDDTPTSKKQKSSPVIVPTFQGYPSNMQFPFYPNPLPPSQPYYYALGKNNSSL